MPPTSPDPLEEAEPAARADLTAIHALLPVRGLRDGKGRLGEALDAEEREALVLGLLSRTLAVLRELDELRAIHLISRDERLLQLAGLAQAHPLVEPAALAGHADGLNDALRIGREAALAGGATAILCLPADLPLVSVASLRRLLDAADAALAAGRGRPIVVAAPADARGGTNALLLSPPAVIEPAFGEASLRAHVQAAARAGATVQLVADADLGFDLDTPEDLELLAAEQLVGLLALGNQAADELFVNAADS